jgi:hypothetical protein
MSSRRPRSLPASFPAVIRRVLFVAAVGLILATAASASSSLPSFYGCYGTNAIVRPQQILIACGDGNYFLAQLKWSRWTRSSAAGVAIAHINDCKPTCAAGTFHWYRHVSVRLTRAKKCSDGHRLFTRIAWTFMKRRPADIQKQAHQKAPFWIKPHCP